MDTVIAFNNELTGLYESRPPISKAKMASITRGAMKAIKFYKHVVQSVEKFILKCKPEYKIPGLYVIDSIVRQSRHQFGAEKDVFAPRFARNMQATFANLFRCASEDKSKIIRVLNLWQKNKVFAPDVIQPLFDFADPNHPIYSMTPAAVASSVDLSNTSNGLNAAKPQESPAASTADEQSAALAMSVDLAASIASGNPTTMRQLHQLQQLLCRQTGNESMASGSGNQESVKFNKKLLEFDYGDDEDEEKNSSPRVQGVLDVNNLSNLLKDPTVLRQLQNLQKLKQHEMEEKQTKLTEMRLQEEAFEKHLANVLQQLPFANECDLSRQPNDLPTQTGASSGIHPANTANIAIMQTSLSNVDPIESEVEFVSDNKVEVINLDGNDSRSPSPDRDRYTVTSSSSNKRTRRSSRSRSRERNSNNSNMTGGGGLTGGNGTAGTSTRSGGGGGGSATTERRSRRAPSRSRSRTRSRSPRSTRRRTSRERTKDKEKEKQRKKEREYEEERRRRGLPDIKKDHLSVCSTTLWVGHLSKLVQQEELSDAFGKYGDIVSIDMIIPRGCAFIAMNRRQDAYRAMLNLKSHKMQGRAITVSWAAGKGVKSKEWKDYWDIEAGVSFIPWSKLNATTDLETLEEGGMLDEDSMPQWIKDRTTMVGGLRLTTGEEQPDMVGMQQRMQMYQQQGALDTSQPPPPPSGAQLLSNVSAMVPPFAMQRILPPPMGMPTMQSMVTSMPMGVPPPQMMMPAPPGLPPPPSLEKALAQPPVPNAGQNQAQLSDLYMNHVHMATIAAAAAAAAAAAGSYGPPPPMGVPPQMTMSGLPPNSNNSSTDDHMDLEMEDEVIGSGGNIHQTMGKSVLPGVAEQLINAGLFNRPPPPNMTLMGGPGNILGLPPALMDQTLTTIDLDSDRSMDRNRGVDDEDRDYLRGSDRGRRRDRERERGNRSERDERDRRSNDFRSAGGPERKRNRWPSGRGRSRERERDVELVGVSDRKDRQLEQEKSLADRLREMANDSGEFDDGWRAGVVGTSASTTANGPLPPPPSFMDAGGQSMMPLLDMNVGIDDMRGGPPISRGDMFDFDVRQRDDFERLEGFDDYDRRGPSRGDFYAANRFGGIRMGLPPVRGSSGGGGPPFGLRGGPMFMRGGPRPGPLNASGFQYNSSDRPLFYERDSFNVERDDGRGGGMRQNSGGSRNSNGGDGPSRRNRQSSWRGTNNGPDDDENCGRSGRGQRYSSSSSSANRQDNSRRSRWGMNSPGGSSIDSSREEKSSNNNNNIDDDATNEQLPNKQISPEKSPDEGPSSGDGASNSAPAQDGNTTPLYDEPVEMKAPVVERDPEPATVETAVNLEATVDAADVGDDGHDVVLPSENSDV